MTRKNVNSIAASRNEKSVHIYARPPPYNARDPSPSQFQLDRAHGINAESLYQGTGHTDPMRADVQQGC